MNTEVSINAKCEITAIPCEDINETLDSIVDNILDPCDIEHEGTFIEFVQHPGLDVNSTLRIVQQRDFYICPTIEDGLYIYNIWRINDTDLTGEATSNGIYYDIENKKLMYKGEEVTDINIILDEYNDVVGIPGILDKDSIPIFSICRLKKCVLDLHKNSVTNCKNARCSKNEDKKQKDFLFISMYILENLICQQRFMEANRILETINGCNLPCKKSSPKNSCGCNG